MQLAASGSSGSGITLSWVGRTRVGGELKDGYGTVLLAEDAEAYELEILGPMMTSGANSRAGSCCTCSRTRCRSALGRGC
jgi:hypothetical protein